MPINLSCLGCGAKLVLDESFAGRLVRCPRCQATFHAPGTAAPRPPTAPPAPAAPRSAPTPPRGVPVQLPAQMMANKLVAGRVCPVCGVAIQLGQPVQNCLTCGSTHHQGCWSGACASPSCPSRAMAIAPAGAGRAQPSSDPSRPTKPCPFCGEAIDGAAMKCRFCNEWLDERMRGGGAEVTAAKKQAGEALACGIIGLLCCGIILGPVAIVKGSNANKSFQKLGLPTDGRATAGVVLGWIDVAFFALWMVLQVGGAMMR